MNLTVVVEKGENGFFSANYPSLKSCWSQGKTQEEALENIKEAIELYFEPELDEIVEDENHRIFELAL